MARISRSLGEMSVRLTAGLTAAMGLVNVFSAIQPAFITNIHLLHQFVPSSLRYNARVATVLAGFGLLLLSVGLWRRKHVAWYLAVAVLALSAIIHVVKGLDIVEAVLSLFLGCWLYVLRQYFQAVSDQPSVRQGIRAIMASIVFTIFYGTVGFYILDRHFFVHFDILASVQQTLLLFIGFGPTATTNFGRHFIDSVYIVSLTTLLYSAWLVLRPLVLRASATAKERTQAIQIVREFGRTQLAEFVLFSDKHYFFSSQGSVIGYVVHDRVALTLGDPIGPSLDRANCLQEFLIMCQKHDWIPAFYQTLDTTIKYYEKLRLKKIMIGHEAIVDVTQFSLEGSQNKELRNTTNRLQRLGYVSEYLSAPIADAVLLELQSISDEWLGKFQGAEKQFSLGWFDQDYIRHCPISIVRNPAGSIVAFASLIETSHRGEVAVDLMCRRDQVENGVMDYLFITLLVELQRQGRQKFNFGLSPLAGVGEHSSDPLIERALKFVYDNMNQLYQFRGLRSFKDKFHPSWSPRFLIAPSMTTLPAIAVALIVAHNAAPQDIGQTVWETLRARLRIGSNAR